MKTLRFPDYVPGPEKWYTVYGSLGMDVGYRFFPSVPSIQYAMGVEE